MKKRFTITTLLGLVTAPLLAQAAAPGAALDGYCAVCIVKMDKLNMGSEKYTSVFDGKKYLFPAAKQKGMFDANPTAFAPVLGGDCIVCKVEKGAKVAGKAEFHVVHDGRLFLFPSEKQKSMFEKNPERYANADLALDGACAVCLVNSDKIVPGKAEFVSMHDGMRYLFPGADQKQMFDANPAAFTPAMNGDCTVCKVEMDKDVTGKAEYRLTHKGRLYLFPSEKQRRMFQANPSRYANADVALNGYCSVCKVEMGKDVLGKADFAADFKGMRYLFPSQKQLDMFNNNPTKYAVN